TLKAFRNKDWEEITEEVFREVFRRSAVKRTKLEGLKRNIKFVAATTPSSSNDSDGNPVREERRKTMITLSRWNLASSVPPVEHSLYSSFQKPPLLRVSPER